MSTVKEGDKKNKFLSNITGAMGLGKQDEPGGQGPAGNRKAAPEILFEDENFLKNPSGRKESSSVITSYSIHYTKLYESTTRIPAV